MRVPCPGCRAVASVNEAVFRDYAKPKLPIKCRGCGMKYDVRPAVRLAILKGGARLPAERQGAS